MSKFNVEISDFSSLLKIAAATSSNDKKDIYHSGVLLMEKDNELLGVGYNPGVCVGAYSTPLSGTFNKPVILPSQSLGVINAFLNNIKNDDVDEVTVGITESSHLRFNVFGANLEIAGIDQGEYLLPEALSILKGQESKEVVKDADDAVGLPSGHRLNLSKVGYKVLSSLASSMGDVSLIPTAHKASWVMLDSPSTPNWNGAILGNTYPADYPVNEVAVPLF